MLKKSFNDEQMKNDLAVKLSKLCFKHPSLVIYLNGPIGAGKTSLVRAFLQANDYVGKVNSPSFGLLNVYELNAIVVHVDLYRFDNFNAPELLMLDEYLHDAIYIIEWSSNAAVNSLPKSDLEIDISYNDNESRMYAINSDNEKLIALLD